MYIALWVMGRTTVSAHSDWRKYSGPLNGCLLEKYTVRAKQAPPCSGNDTESTITCANKGRHQNTQLRIAIDCKTLLSNLQNSGHIFIHTIMQKFGKGFV